MADGILAALSSDANKALRGVLQETGRPQVINLENLDFINDTIEEINKDAARKGGAKRQVSKFTDDANGTVLQEARKLAARRQKNFINKRKRQLSKIRNVQSIEDTDEWERLATYFPKVAADVSNGTSFIVVSFRSLVGLKNKIVELALKNRTKAIKAEVKSRIDRGHGIQGGSAVSTLQLADAQGTAQQEGVDLGQLPGLEEYLVEQFDSQEYIKQDSTDLAKFVKQVFVDYRTVVDSNGNVSAEYVPVITFQDWFSNRGLDSKTEQFVKDSVTKFFEKTLVPGDIILLDGSKNLKDNIETQIVTTLVGKKNSKNVKVTRRLDSKIDKSAKKVKGSQNKTSKPKLSKAAKRGSVPKARVASRRTTESSISLLRFIAIINAKLPQAVMKNMKAPGLENRTGRFASSVQVTDVIPTPQGFPSVGYTYQKNPYQTFEPGFKQGSIDRDPRRVIDQSIRELASQLVTVRLYTRRV